MPRPPIALDHFDTVVGKKHDPSRDRPPSIPSLRFLARSLAIRISAPSTLLRFLVAVVLQSDHLGGGVSRQLTANSIRSGCSVSCPTVYTFSRYLPRRGLRPFSISTYLPINFSGSSRSSRVRCTRVLGDNEETPRRYSRARGLHEPGISSSRSRRDLRAA